MEVGIKNGSTVHRLKGVSGFTIGEDGNVYGCLRSKSIEIPKTVFDLLKPSLRDGFDFRFSLANLAFAFMPNKEKEVVSITG